MGELHCCCQGEKAVDSSTLAWEYLGIQLFAAVGSMKSARAGKEVKLGSAAVVGSPI